MVNERKGTAPDDFPVVLSFPSSDFRDDHDNSVNMLVQISLQTHALTPLMRKRKTGTTLVGEIAARLTTRPNSSKFNYLFRVNCSS
jgi:hypothetical protein